MYRPTTAVGIPSGLGGRAGSAAVTVGMVRLGRRGVLSLELSVFWEFVAAGFWEAAR